MHKLTSHSFQRENDEGDNETVKGSLVVMPPDDGDYSPGRNIGQVVFVVDNETDTKDTETKDTRSASQPQPRGKS